MTPGSIIDTVYIMTDLNSGKPGPRRDSTELSSPPQQQAQGALVRRLGAAGAWAVGTGGLMMAEILLGLPAPIAASTGIGVGAVRMYRDLR